MLQLGLWAMWSQVPSASFSDTSSRHSSQGTKRRRAGTPNHQATASAATQGQRGGRDHVEALPHRDAPAVERQPEGPGHVVGVDVMHRLHPEVG